MVHSKDESEFGVNEQVLVECKMFGQMAAATPDTPNKDRTTFAARVVARTQGDGTYASLNTLKVSAVDNGDNLPVQVGTEYTVKVSPNSKLCSAQTGWRHLASQQNTPNGRS